MNNPNPFHPQVSLLDQKNKKRARVKVAVLSIFAFNILLISPLLIQGCGDKKPAAQTDTSGTPGTDTNVTGTADTSTAPPSLPTPTNVVTPPSLPPQNVSVPPPPPPPATTTDYVIVKGDTFSKIAHDHALTVKALEAANPGVDPAKLQIGKKLQLPPPSAPAVGPATAAVADSADTYTVKSGDSLYKIAHDHGTSVKALRAANDLKTDKIKVGQKLKLPVAGATAPADVTPPPTSTTASTSSVVPAPTSATGH